MEPLICPQCGGKITNYVPGQASTTCGYCSTTFLIDSGKIKNVNDAPITYSPTQGSTPNIGFVGVLTGVIVVIGGIIAIAALMSLRTNPTKTKTFIPSVNPIATPRTSPSPSQTTNPNLLEFGGPGSGNGLFQSADSLAVDGQGRIYVGDESLRVQQFDQKGEYLKTLIVPSKTSYYVRARQINKIAVSADGLLYVAVGGVILVYDETSTTPLRTIHDAPNYITDFALRSDGRILMISFDDKIESLLFATKTGQISRRIRGFLTNTADAALSPPETAMLAIRIAVDGPGNIYAVYALGDIGSYELSYDTEDLVIFRFNADGKYLNKFVESMDSCGIEVDSRSRIYTSRSSMIEMHSGNGELLSVFADVGQPTAFALDKENDVYALANDKVIKRKGIN